MERNFYLREVKTSDAKRLSEIYSYYVINTPVSFETEAVSADEFEKRINGIKDDYPFLTAIYNNEVIGYADAHRHHPRQAYDWNVEISVYLDKKILKHGIGSILYEALIKLLKLQNIKNIYAFIVVPNDASMALHEKFGFTKICEYIKTGYKLGNWHNIVIMEKVIGDKSQKPEIFIKFKNLNVKNVAVIINSFNRMYE